MFDTGLEVLRPLAAAASGAAGRRGGRPAGAAGFRAMTPEARGDGRPADEVRLRTVRADHEAPGAFGTLREAARQAADEAREGAHWTGPRRAAALRTLDQVTGLLATARGALLLAERDAGTSVGIGDRDFASARARTTRTGLGQAYREVRQAQMLADLPAVATAVAEGDVPVGHVDALARAVTHAGEAAVAALSSSAGQAQLVDLGSRLPEREFATRVAQLVAAHDPAAVQADFDRQHAARFFTMTPTSDGVLLKGRLDRINGERLRVAIDATGVAPDEHRDALQARADALVAVVERSLAGLAGIGPRHRRRAADETPRRAAELDAAHAAAQDTADRVVSGSANRPHVALLVPAETFAAVRELQRAQAEAAMLDAPTGPASGPVAGERQPSDPVEPATLEDGTPVAASELARILCDAEVSRIALDADSLPLDLGRSARLYTGAHRRAVVVRDRQCAWNGCSTVAAWCEVHHARWWGRDAGPTSVENGVLLCAFHHHLVHRLDLTIRRGLPPGGLRHGPGRLGHEPPHYTFRRRVDDRMVNEPPPPRRT